MSLPLLHFISSLPYLNHLSQPLPPLLSITFIHFPLFLSHFPSPSVSLPLSFLTSQWLFSRLTRLHFVFLRLLFTLARSQKPTHLSIYAQDPLSCISLLLPHIRASGNSVDEPRFQPALASPGYINSSHGVRVSCQDTSVSFNLSVTHNCLYHNPYNYSQSTAFSVAV